jgi:hypothetical protein
MRGIRSKTLMQAYVIDEDKPLLVQGGPRPHRLIHPDYNSEIIFDEIQRKFKFKTKNFKDICPLVYEESLTDLFVEYANRSSENMELIMALMDNSPNSAYSICLCKGVTYTPAEDSGLQIFRVYGTTAYGNGKLGFKSRFDGVEVKFASDGNAKICQVFIL